MRLDKYIKVSRIIKRRTVAKEIAESGRININGKKAKPSTKVKVDDIIEIYFGNKLLTFKVKAIIDSTKKEDASFMYEIISEEKLDKNNIVN